MSCTPDHIPDENVVSGTYLVELEDFSDPDFEVKSVKLVLDGVAQGSANLISLGGDTAGIQGYNVELTELIDNQEYELEFEVYEPRIERTTMIKKTFKTQQAFATTEAYAQLAEGQEDFSMSFSNYLRDGLSEDVQYRIGSNTDPLKLRADVDGQELILSTLDDDWSSVNEHVVVEAYRVIDNQEYIVGELKVNTEVRPETDITGTLKDAITGETYAGVTIYDLNDTELGITQSDGSFKVQVAQGQGALMFRDDQGRIVETRLEYNLSNGGDDVDIGQLYTVDGNPSEFNFDAYYDLVRSNSPALDGIVRVFHEHDLSSVYVNLTGTDKNGQAYDVTPEVTWAVEELNRLFGGLHNLTVPGENNTVTAAFANEAEEVLYRANAITGETHTAEHLIGIITKYLSGGSVVPKAGVCAGEMDRSIWATDSRFFYQRAAIVYEMGGQLMATVKDQSSRSNGYWDNTLVAANPPIPLENGIGNETMNYHGREFAKVLAGALLYHQIQGARLGFKNGTIPQIKYDMNNLLGC